MTCLSILLLATLVVSKAMVTTAAQDHAQRNIQGTGLEEQVGFPLLCQPWRKESLVWRCRFENEELRLIEAVLLSKRAH
jgi:hypothetical protein